MTRATSCLNSVILWPSLGRIRRSGLPSRFSLLRTLVCGWWWHGWWLVGSGIQLRPTTTTSRLSSKQFITNVVHVICTWCRESMQYSEDALLVHVIYFVWFCFGRRVRLKCPISCRIPIVDDIPQLLQFIEINVPPLGETICPPLSSSYDLRLLLLSCQMELR